MVKNPPSTSALRSSQGAYDPSPSTVALQDEMSASSTRRYFKVPADQRSANPEVYKPHLFSFGPYHAAACFGPCNILASPAGGSFCFSPQQQPDSAASADVTVEGRSLSTERTLSHTSCSFRTAVSFQPSSCAITADGDHFKHLAAEELGLQDRSELIHKINQHDRDFRNMYVQMSQGQLDVCINSGCLADLLALDSIAIVAATMPINITELIYSIRRLILSDAILLENQIPVLVVNHALESISIAGKVPASQVPTLQNVLKWYLERMSPFKLNEQPLDLIIDMEKPLLHHIYDYLTQDNRSGDVYDTATRCTLKPTALVTYIYHYLTRANCTGHVRDTATSTDSVPALPSASHLARCGVRFRSCQASFKGIRFDEKNAVLYIPKVQVTDTTVRFLHNLLAYEATARYPGEFSVISYVHFMDRLIDTEDDSRVLVEAGVIGNALGSHADVATMWNKLGISVLCRITPEDGRYMKQLEALTKRRLRRWRAAFEEKYWERQPWLLISLLAACILLVLTLLQTIYTMKSSFAPAP